MTELRVMAVTSDGSRLVLRSSDGQEFHLAGTGQPVVLVFLRGFG